MRVTNNQYAETLALLAEGEVKDVAQKFLGYLKSHKETKRLPGILAAFEEQQEKSANLLPLEVVTAHTVSESLLGKIQKKAEKLFPHKKIQLKSVVDPAVIGGFRLKGREEDYDATLKNTLRHFHANLKS